VQTHLPTYELRPEHAGLVPVPRHDLESPREQAIQVALVVFAWILVPAGSGEHARSGVSSRDGVRLTPAEARKTALVTAEPRSSIRTHIRQRGQHSTRSANVLASPRQPPGALLRKSEGRIEPAQLQRYRPKRVRRSSAFVACRDCLSGPVKPKL